jgi:riboflavin kinase/FMN adenylyltransferase
MVRTARRCNASGFALSTAAMRTYGGSERVLPAERGCVLTVGNFDGVHLGHQALLAAVVERARALSRPAAVYTFDPHPRRVLAPDRAEPLLMTPAQLEAELAARGIDVLVREAFTAAFSTLDAEAFLSDVLFARLAPAEIFVGRDFHFGKGRGGSDQTLAQLGPGLGMRVVIIPQVRAGGADVSSTRVRKSLARGDVADAALCLGRPYAIHGKVVVGDRRGRTLGFPTANLEPENELCPSNGVYATRVRFLDPAASGARAWPAVTNIGTRPTFEAGRVLVEAHLLDWTGDLYGRRIELGFVERLRDERRFPDVEALRRQIAADADAARARLGAAG